MVFLAYLMLNFTKLVNARDLVTNEVLIADPDQELYIQYLAIAIIVFMTLVNIYAMAVISCRKLMLSCKKSKMAKLAKEAEKRRLENEKAKKGKKTATLKTIPEDKEEIDES